MSAVAALAVASPFAVSAVAELNARSTPAPEHHEFVQAAMITDLPGEIMSALQSSLSQFGIVVPNMSGILGPSSTPPVSSGLMTPGLASPGLASPGLASPGLTSPGLTAPGLTAPTVGSPPAGASTPGLGTAPALTSPALTDPALANPALTDPGLTDPGLTNPGLTNPTAATPSSPSTLPGLNTPPTGLNPALTSPTGLNPALTSPTGLTPGLGAAPGEVPIAAPLGPDPLAGTYPILGDPSLGMPVAAPAPSGGLVSDLSNVFMEMGGSQAIDLLKGVVVPSIMNAIKGAAPAPAAPAPVPAPPAPVPPAPAV